jgi:probable HAF family extracellular repeat protein
MWMAAMHLFALLVTIAQAEIVYTPVNVNLPTNGDYEIDLNHDGITDFTFQVSHTVVVCGYNPTVHNILRVQPNQAAGIDGGAWALALESGLVIDFRQHFDGGDDLMYDVQTAAAHCPPPHRYGYWVAAQDHYLGLEFQINGETHYGWAELSTDGRYGNGEHFLYGFAYETIPFKAILTGQTSDSPDEPAMDSGSSESKLPGPATTATQDSPSQDHQHRHHQYKLVDVGTLGGPNSYLNYASTVGRTNGIFVGQADTPTPAPSDTNPFNCFGPDVMNAFKWEDGVLTNLHSLNGDQNCSQASLIGPRGMFAGNSENGAVDPITGFKEIRAVVWKDGAIIDLGTFGGNHSGAQGIAGGDQVVGFALNTIPDPFSIFDFFFLGFSNGTQTRAFLWEEGKGMQDLGTLGSGNDAVPFTANVRGQVAGAAYTNSTPNPSTNLPTLDPFFWDKKNGMIDIGTLGGTLGLPNFLNDRGQVVGTSNLLGDLFSHGFFWDRGVITDLGTLGGNNSTANQVNDAGEVVGISDTPVPNTVHAFLWKNGVMTDIDNGVGHCSNANGINSPGQIVGAAAGCGQPAYPFLWEDGGPMVDLRTLVVNGSNLTLGEAFFIYDSGEILVRGFLPDGDQHGVVLIPCDEKHPGECEDYSMIEVETPQPGEPTKQLSATVKESNETLATPLERVRNMMRLRYHIPGQALPPRD